MSRAYFPEKLGDLLRRPVFSYANVPYRIRPFEDLLRNPKSTVDFDQAAATQIEADVASYLVLIKDLVQNNPGPGLSGLNFSQKRPPSPGGGKRCFFDGQNSFKI